MSFKLDLKLVRDIITGGGDRNQVHDRTIIHFKKRGGKGRYSVGQSYNGDIGGSKGCRIRSSFGNGLSRV